MKSGQPSGKMHPRLPISRIKTIIKSSADVDVVSKESTFVITRAAEFFIKQLASEAFKNSKKGKKLDYKNIATVVNSHSRYEFLKEIIPMKVTVREYLKLMKQKKVEVEGNYLSSESSSSEENSEADEDKNSRQSAGSDVLE